MINNVIGKNLYDKYKKQTLKFTSKDYNEPKLSGAWVYIQTCLKHALKIKTKHWFSRLIIAKCRPKREHSAILSAFIKLPALFKTLVLSIFERPLKTGFTVICSLVRAFPARIFTVWEQLELPRPLLRNSVESDHRSTLITRMMKWRWRHIMWRWLHINHVNTITSVIAAKQMA